MYMAVRIASSRNCITLGERWSNVCRPSLVRTLYMGLRLHLECCFQNVDYSKLKHHSRPILYNYYKAEWPFKDDGISVVDTHLHFYFLCVQITRFQNLANRMLKPAYIELMYIYYNCPDYNLLTSKDGTGIEVTLYIINPNLCAVWSMD